MGTVPIDLVVNLWIGLLFAWAAKEQFRAGSPPWRRELLAALSFAGLVMAPVALYFYFAWPDWAWMYTRDAARTSVALALLVVAADVASLLVGYGAGWVLARDGRDRVLRGALAGVGAAGLLLALALSHRLASDGTYAEFRAGHAASASDGRLVWLTLVATVGVASGVAAVAWTLHAHGRNFARAFRPDEPPPAEPPPAEPPPAGQALS